MKPHFILGGASGLIPGKNTQSKNSRVIVDHHLLDILSQWQPSALHTPDRAQSHQQPRGELSLLGQGRGGHPLSFSGQQEPGTGTQARALVTLLSPLPQA